MTLKYSTVIGICLVFSLDLHHSCAQNLPFEDDFNDGIATDGNPGTWIPGGQPGATQDASSGDFVITHNGQSWARVEELAGLKDVSIRTQVRFFLNSTNGDFASVWARAVGDFGSYWAGVRENGFLGIGRENVDGTRTNLATRSTSLDPVTGDVALRFDVFGNQLSLFAWQAGNPMPLAPQLTATDNVWTVGGDMGLTLTTNLFGGSNTASVAFRHFAVIPEPRPGDFNMDGKVDGRDFLAWQRGESPTLLGGTDLALWQAYYGAASPQAATLMVPEPTPLVVFGVSALVISACRHGIHCNRRK